MKRYTINEFRAEFSNDDVCLDRILKLRYTKQPCCPQCSQETTFKRIKGRRAYQCSDKDCQYQLYPTAGTVFEKVRTPLANIFYVIYLMTSTRNGVSAKEIERQLGVTYKCAWSLGHRIRKLMAQGDALLSGIVEVDETVIGGKSKFKHKSYREKNKMNSKRKGDYSVNKVVVMALLERGGNITTRILDGQTPFKSIVYKHVGLGSTVMTDSATSYKGLQGSFQHGIVQHNKDEYAVGERHTNTIEGFFSHLKRTIKGTHIHVSAGHMQKYIDECAFKYVHRKQGQEMFYSILGKVA